MTVPPAIVGQKIEGGLTKVGKRILPKKEQLIKFKTEAERRETAKMTAENYEMAVDLDAGADEMVTDDAVDETDRVKSNATKRKGRGFAQSGGYNRKDAIGTYETVEDEVQGTAQRSIEGWIILITGVHEEATEEDVMERVAEYGEIRNMHLNLDRRTGYVKGYALVEYSTYPEAKAAVDGLNGSTLLEQAIHADFAFVRGASFSALERVRGARRNGRR